MVKQFDGNMDVSDLEQLTRTVMLELKLKANQYSETLEIENKEQI